MHNDWKKRLVVFSLLVVAACLFLLGANYAEKIDAIALPAIFVFIFISFVTFFPLHIPMEKPAPLRIVSRHSLRAPPTL